MMLHFLQELKSRNETLFWFSAILCICSVVFYFLTKTTTSEVAGVNTWFKPMKFSISIAVYCSTMAWYCAELPAFNVKAFTWTNILLFTFETVYIVIQAARAEESHFNWSTPFYKSMFVAMAIAAIAITLYAAFVAVQFLQTDFPSLPTHYVWSIRLGLLIFIIFSFEGLLMGGRQTHSVGTSVQTTFLHFLKWNMQEGDLRVAHFFGMHALQVLPLLSFYVLKNTKAVFAGAALYLLFAVFVLVQALHAKPFIPTQQHDYEIENQ